MAIISPQRNAIVSLESRVERSPMWYRHDVTWIDGQVAHPIGVSQGRDSRGPKVLVFGEGAGLSRVDMDSVDWPTWDFAVLLREPKKDERSEAPSQVDPNALETVELLEPTVDELCLSYTGVAETYARIAG